MLFQKRRSVIEAGRDNRIESLQTVDGLDADL
jgi:hypothetical protein